MARALALAAAALASCAVAAPLSAYVISDTTGALRVLNGTSPGGALAWGAYDAASLFTTGWAVLDLAANASELNATLASYAIGFLEGFLCVNELATFAANTGAAAPPSKKLERFIDDNSKWMAEQVAAQSASDPYWAHVGAVLAQVAGQADGQRAAGGTLSAATLLQGIINGGDIFNLEPLYGGASAEQLARSPAAARRAAAHADARADHCSAMVRLTPDAADIVVTHTTWSGFETMLRVAKRYDLALSGVTGTPVPGRFTALSGYPGYLSYSSDDFYVLSSGLVTLETTIDNNNQTLAREFKEHKVVLEWLRNVLANRLAVDGPSWAALFSRYASGTYTNQWMIVDAKLFSPGTPPPAHTLTVLEELPGNIAVHDRTPELRGDAGHELWGGAAWASYNVISDERLFELSGAQLLVDQYGGITGPGAYFSWLNTSRANIFRREAASVVDLPSMQRVIRYNEFKTDPLSRLGCGSAPPYSATNAIADRSDLNEKKGDYVIPDLGKGDSAGIDAKITLLSWLKGARVADGELPLAAISGPTITASCPVFAFSNASVKAPHAGLPDVFDFPWLLRPFG